MTDDLVKRLREFEQWMRNPEDQKFTLSSDLFDEAASRIEELEAQRDYFQQQYVRKCEHEFEVRKRIEQLEAALNRIAMEDARLDEPALWLDDDMPLGLFIAMTLGEKKDD